MEEVAARAGLPSPPPPRPWSTPACSSRQSTEREYAHVDADRLVGGGRTGHRRRHALGDAETVDVEDYAILFELERLRAQRARAAPASPSKLPLPV